MTSNSSIEPKDLAGISMFNSDYDEIVVKIEGCVCTNDEFLFGECARALGHLARRFTRVDEELVSEILLKAYRFSGSKHVKGTIYEMFEDIQNFVPDPPIIYYLIDYLFPRD